MSIMKNTSPIKTRTQRRNIVRAYAALRADFDVIVRDRVERQILLREGDVVHYSPYFVGWGEAEIAKNETQHGGTFSTFEATVVSQFDDVPVQHIWISIREVVEAYEAGEHLSGGDAR